MVTLKRLERILSSCSCGQPPRTKTPSPRFQHCSFLSSGCHLQQEVVLEAFNAALQAGALGTPGLEDIPSFILSNRNAQIHLSAILASLIFDPDHKWEESCGGKGCTPEIVRALLACGVGATTYSVLLPVWQDNVAHPYSLAAFAMSEANERGSRSSAAAPGGRGRPSRESRGVDQHRACPARVGLSRRCPRGRCCVGPSEATAAAHRCLTCNCGAASIFHGWT